MKSILINEFINKTLNDNFSDVSINVFYAEENTPLPIIVYEKTSHNISYEAKVGIHNINITFFTLANTYIKSLELSEKIISTFQDNRNIIEGLTTKCIRLISIDETYDEGVYMHRLDFEIKILEE